MAADNRAAPLRISYLLFASDFSGHAGLKRAHTLGRVRHTRREGGEDFTARGQPRPLAARARAAPRDGIEAEKLFGEHARNISARADLSLKVAFG